MIPRRLVGKLRDLFGGARPKRIARSAGVLFGANTASSLLGLASFALVARSLGAAQFGGFALVTAYAFVVDTLVNFQSWQAIIRYGAADLQRGDARAFCGLIKFGTLLDATCAAASTIIAVVLVPFLAPLLGFQGMDVHVLALYCLVILSRATGTPTAILRLFDLFRTVATIQVSQAILRVLLVAGVYAAKPSLSVFLAIWALTEVAGNVAVIASAWRALKKRGYLAVMSVDLREIRGVHSGLWSFVWSTNFQNSLKLGLREADVLALGAMVGQSSAGLYKIVKQVETIATKAFGPLTQVIYPELATAAATQNKARFVKIIVLCSFFGLAVLSLLLFGFYLFGKGVISSVLGSEFTAAYEPALVYLLGTLISAVTVALHPSILALGMPHRSLRILAFSTALYVIVFGVLVYQYQLLGASIAYVFFYLLWATLSIRLLKAAMSAFRGVRSVEA